MANPVRSSLQDFEALPALQGRCVLFVDEMGQADRLALAAGVSEDALMEAAGWAVAAAIARAWTRRPVVVLRGPGNNGGDGSVVARVLARRGWRVRVLDLFPDKPPVGTAARMARRWRGPVGVLTPEALRPGELVVDALFGAGLARPLDGGARAVLERVAALGLDVVAVDVPSGLDGDTGQVWGIAPRCALCVTFFQPKPGHLLYPGRALCGKLTVADIGIPAAVLDTLAPRVFVNGPGCWTLPTPPLDAHKYRRGHVTVIAGPRLTGAARLAARAARRAGAGLVTLAGPAATLAVLGGDQPGALLWDLEADGGLDALLADPRRSVYVFGPGRGRSAACADEALVLAASGRSVVLDADALTSLEGRLDSLRHALERSGGACVLTPHDGEAARLFGPAGFSQDRLTRARAAAAASGAVVVLKGPDCVIAAPDGRACITVNAPPWLATAGSGDVLAGLIGGLLAQGMGALEAAAAGVWRHGQAALAVGASLVAEDLCRGPLA